MKRLIALSIVCVVLSGGLTGCLKKDVKKPEPPPLSDMHRKFITIAQEEFGYQDIHIRDVGKTVWIYLPMRERIIDIKASPGQASKSTQTSEEKFSVRHIKTDVASDHLTVAYDIQKSNVYQDDPGYGSNYSEEYSRAQQDLMQAISRVYFDFAEGIRLASDHPDNPQDLPGVPKFMVMVIADVEKGIEIESIFNFSDLQKAMSLIPSITGEEFLKRYVADVRGNTAIVDDETGDHLNYRDIDMKEFLSRQIENRVNYKYLHSSAKPAEDPKQEILLAISDALQAYQYQGLMGLTFKDLARDVTETVSKDELNGFMEAHPVKEIKGKVINVRFGL